MEMYTYYRDEAKKIGLTDEREVAYYIYKKMGDSFIFDPAYTYDGPTEDLFGNDSWPLDGNYTDEVYDGPTEDLFGWDTIPLIVDCSTNLQQGQTPTRRR